MILPSVFDDAFAYVLHYLRKTVAAYMRMCISQDGFGGTELHQLIQDLPYVSPLCGTGVEFSV